MISEPQSWTLHGGHYLVLEYVCGRCSQEHQLHLLASAGVADLHGTSIISPAVLLISGTPVSWYARRRHKRQVR